jgi:hypothetical protein
MDAAEQEAVRAKELTRLNASAKGFRSQFVSTRNVLMQALPLYADGATASRRRTIDEAIGGSGCKLTRYTRPIIGSSNLKTMNITTSPSRRGRTTLPPITTTFARTRTKYSEKQIDHSINNSSLGKSKATSSQQRWLQ